MQVHFDFFLIVTSTLPFPIFFLRCQQVNLILVSGLLGLTIWCFVKHSPYQDGLQVLYIMTQRRVVIAQAISVSFFALPLSNWPTIIKFWG